MEKLSEFTNAENAKKKKEKREERRKKETTENQSPNVRIRVMHTELIRPAKEEKKDEKIRMKERHMSIYTVRLLQCCVFRKLHTRCASLKSNEQ